MTIPFHSQPRRGAAFTLVEVILAIVIALGILVVLLYFYQQATNLRTQAIQETERISVARLFMDRITAELRAAQSEPAFGQGFSGNSNSIQFVKPDVPSFSAWMGGALGRATAPVTDLKLIKYQLDTPDGTNVAGLVRSEESVLPKHGSLVSDEPAATNGVPNALRPPVLEEIRFVQFRYWGGTNWLDTWNSSGTPDAVEISVGAEVMTNSTDLADYPGDIFRRVLYIAGKTVASSPSSAAAQPTSDTAPPEEPLP